MDEFLRCESTIGHAGEDSRHIVRRLWDGLVAGRERRVRATSQELQAGCTGAVGDTNSTCELDQVASSDQVTLQEWLECIDGVIDTVVGMEVGLDVGEDDHGAVSTGTLELYRLGEADGIVECQAENFVDWKVSR